MAARLRPIGPSLCLTRPHLGWIAVYGGVPIAWVGLWSMLPDAGPVGAPPGIWESLCIGAAGAGFGTLWAMWALMVAAMMLPGFVLPLATWRDLSAAGAGGTGGSLALVAGYLVIWLGAAGLGALAQLVLSRAALPGPGGSVVSAWASAALVIGAGLYQFSALKEACLPRCRLPLTWFMGRWRPGSRPALRMEAEMGPVRLGCCWALMALGFVGGTMNLLWMGLATLFMTFEKLPRLGRPLTRPAGAALILGGVLTAVTAV